MNSSLLYEILLYLNSFYFGMFALCEFIIFLIKYLKFDIPSETLISELGILIFLIIIEPIRIVLGRKGNLTENSLPVILSILLTIPAALGVLYCLLWQTYILRLDMILCFIQLSLLGGELVLALISLIPMYKSSPY